MHPDDEPIAGEESLLRRVASSRDRFKFPDGPFLFVAFLPNKGDPSGLSLFRLGPKYMTHPQRLLDVAETEAVKQYGGVAAVTADQVRGAGGDPTPRRDEKGLPGHCEIEEMSHTLYTRSKADKNRIKDMADRLSRVATILIAPRERAESEVAV